MGTLPARRIVAVPDSAAETTTAKPRVTLVAYQRLIGEALTSLLDATHELTIQLVQDPATPFAVTHTDVVLLDVGGFNDDEQALVERLGHPGVRPPVLLLVDHVDANIVDRAMRAQVEGVLGREASAASFLMAIKQVLAGQSVFPAARTVGWGAGVNDRDGMLLSPRQRDVLRLVAEGRSNDEIGRELFISVNTVKFHLREIFRKLGLRNRVQAAQHYAQLRR
jgi:two-component system response regulator DevR